MEADYELLIVVLEDRKKGEKYNLMTHVELEKI